MHSIETIVEAIIAKTHLMLATAKSSQRPTIIAERIRELAGMLELTHWREELELERAIEAHVSELRDELDCDYFGMRVISVALAAEFVELCERDKVQPETVLRGFIADLCGLMNWVRNPRADGYSSNGSDERDLAEHYYDRVGYPYFHRDP